jgi:hypothetical protein
MERVLALQQDAAISLELQKVLLECNLVVHKIFFSDVVYGTFYKWFKTPSMRGLYYLL